MSIVAEADFIDYVGSEIYANQPHYAVSLAAAELAVKQHCRRDFTLAGTPRTVSDGVTVISDATVTSATAAFVASDVGMVVAGVGIPAGATIASINSASSIELSAAATASGTGLTLTVTPPPRLFVPPLCGNVAYVDDFAGTVGLTVTNNTSVVAAADFQLEPLNGLEYGVTVAYTKIRLISGVWYRNGGQATLSMVAPWGWPSMPSAVVEACRVLAKDLAGLRDSRFGVAGWGEFGVVRMRENPQVVSLLAPYVRWDRAGIA